MDNIAAIVPSIHTTTPGREATARPSSCSDIADIDTPCAGFPACPSCAAGFEHASVLRATFLADIRELGWLTNEKNSGPPAQSGEFISVAFDTVAGPFHLTPDQAASLVRRCDKLLRLCPSTA